MLIGCSGRRGRSLEELCVRYIAYATSYASACAGVCWYTCSCTQCVRYIAYATSYASACAGVCWYTCSCTQSNKGTLPKTSPTSYVSVCYLIRMRMLPHTYASPTRGLPRRHRPPHTYAYATSYVCVCYLIRMRMLPHTCAYATSCMYVCLYTCMYLCMYVCMYVWIYIYTYIYVYIYIYTYVYVYI
jgi:hypothetical protein